MFSKWVVQFFDATGNINPGKVDQFIKEAFYDASDLINTVDTTQLPQKPSKKELLLVLLAFGFFSFVLGKSVSGEGSSNVAENFNNTAENFNKAKQIIAMYAVS